MKNCTILLAVIFLTSILTAQKVGINTTNPAELLHMRTDNSKLAMRLDNTKTAAAGVNYFMAYGSPTTIENFVVDTSLIDWTDLNATKLVNSDNSRLNSPQLQIFPEIANTARIYFNFSPTIPSTATITDVTLYAEWRRNGTYAGEIRITSTILKKASNNQPLLSFGFESITSSTDVTVAMPYKEVYTPVTPDMLNLGDVFISLYNLHSVSQGLSRLEIDRIWLEVEYNVPSTGTENISWTAGVNEGSYLIANSLDMLSDQFLSIDETGTTQLKGLRIAKGAAAGKVLTSNNEGKAFWAALPATNVSSLNDLIDARTDANNFFIGQNAGESISTGLINTGVGINALHNISSGNYNTALGGQALYSNTGSSNTGIGYLSLTSNTGGLYNTAIGSGSMVYNTMGGDNTAIGLSALNQNISGSHNTAIGSSSLKSNLGNDNTAAGSSALNKNTTGSENTALGKNALLNNTTGAQNVAVGFGSGPTVTTAILNQCTILGANSTLNTSRTNVTMLGSGLTSTLCTADNQVLLGNSATAQIRAQVTSITSYSDARIKTDIKSDVRGLDFINRLRPVTYHQDPLALHRILNTPDSLINAIDHTEIMETKFIGFLAQEVKAAADASGFDFPGIDIPKNEHEVYSLRYVDFIMPMTKAIQELSEKNNRQTETINILLDRLQALEHEVSKMKNQ